MITEKMIDQCAHGPDETLNIEDWLTGFKIYILSVMKLDQV